MGCGCLSNVCSTNSTYRGWKGIRIDGFQKSEDSIWSRLSPDLYLVQYLVIQLKATQRTYDTQYLGIRTTLLGGLREKEK